MPDYIQVTIPVASQALKDLLVAELAECGFEGFEEAPELLKAYIPEAGFYEAQLKAVIEPHHLSFEQTVIPQTNWNASWEASFEPVVVEGFCSIRASFHPPAAATRYEIVITPKMSFGTGHHATTYMMIMAMESLGLTGKTVLDFGTGTGVLAILAEKMGAQAIDAIDNDDWSIENGKENLELNNCRHIRLFKADSLQRCGTYDVILANINRNVILAQLPAMKQHLQPGGTILLSGILDGDFYDVTRAAAVQGLQSASRIEKNNWISIKLLAAKD